jgi:predicted negative regulator of RcsB-dependent stress response
LNHRPSKDAKTPDQMTQTLRKGFVWTTTHSKIVAVGIIVFVAIGLGTSLYGYFVQQKEIAQQEKYFLLEKNYLAKKADFDTAERAASMPKDKKAPPADTGKMPTGDIAKDYGTALTDLENFINENPQTQAAQMAVLHLTDSYMKYKNPDAALALIQKVQPSLDKKEVLSALVHIQWGNILAGKGDCNGALPHWEQVTQVKRFAFAHDEARLRMGFCYQSMNDVAKAEQIYTEVAKSAGTTDRDFAAAREAEKFLRLIKAKKNL